MPFMASVENTFAFGRNVPPAYRFYRWQITASKTMPPEGGCVQASEFVFQLNGVDQQSITSAATVTNPGGNNPVGETPPNLVDANLLTKTLDLNFVSNGNVTNFIFTFSIARYFTSYRWATANDFDSRDPATWTVSGSSNGTTWTVLSSVTGFSATASRNTYQTPWALITSS
jgi:hypothetical protein